MGHQTAPIIHSSTDRISYTMATGWNVLENANKHFVIFPRKEMNEQTIAKIGDQNRPLA